MALELNLNVGPLGSTTFRNQRRRKGIEPDECYYVQNAAAVQGNDDIDLSTVPPPDLAVEVDIKSSSLPRQPVYAALKIPELWRYDGKKFWILKLDSHGKYRAVERSGAFAFLPIAEFEVFLHRLGTGDQNAVLREFREWVKTPKA
jgi:Uma2 family endonuclease